MIKSVLSGIVCLSLLASCSSDNNFDTSILIGKWESNDENTFIEQWEKTDKGLEGMGYNLINGKPHNIEYLSLMRKNDTLIYGADVSNQNDRPVYFKCVDESKDKIVFENSGHDFPQQIIYQYVDKNTLEVVIQSLDGNPSIPFHFEKKE